MMLEEKIMTKDASSVALTVPFALLIQVEAAASFPPLLRPSSSSAALAPSVATPVLSPLAQPS